MLFKNISIIYRHSAILFQHCTGAYQLNNTEQSVLLYLSHHQDVNQHAIGYYFQFNKATVTKTLAMLEEKGLIKREVSCESKREKRVNLTETGKALSASVVKKRRQIEEAVLADFTEEEKKNFDVLSERIAKSVWKMTQETEKICTKEKKEKEEK